MPENLGLVLFAESDVPDLLRAMGYRLEGAKILTGQGSQVRCEECRDRLSVENLGHVVKGSFRLYCDDPACILDHLNKDHPV